ncbi:MAG: methyltransferase domain-containing protein [Anaerolineaceae bacterium]|nr:methyltransferase domain-containing protein [Anaerolineaceae bacterium]
MTRSSKAQSQERFNQYAQGYVTSKTHAKGGELERLLTIADPQPEWVALDIATGGGHTALKFAPHVAHVTASDITPNMLDAARNFITGQGITNVDFQLADAENLPFEDDHFDLVTCRIAPHHFPNAAQFVREAVRVLRPGGLLLVQDQVAPEDYVAKCYTNTFEQLRDPSHNQVFTEGEWVALFEAAGLTVEHTEQLVKRHEMVHWAEMQGCTPFDIEQLQVLLQVAPPLAAAWMQAERVGTPEASFANHHILIAGHKPEA